MNNTLENGFRLVALMAENGETFSVTQLSELSGLPPSHVCRLLKSMIKTGYIEQLPENRQYRVSLKLLQLSQARLMKLDLRRIGHPFVGRLSLALQAPVFLSAPCQGRSIIVDVVWPVAAGQDPVLVVGGMHSVRQSACGKICAAYCTEADREALEALVRMELGPAAFTDWQRELAEIRDRRLAVRQEDRLVAVAAPVFRAGGVFSGAIGAYVSDGEQTSTALEQAVKQTAEALSFALGQPFSD